MTPDRSCPSPIAPLQKRPRLVDQVAAATATVTIVDGAGVRIMPGSAGRAAAVAACPLRYVLADEVTALCRARAMRRDAAPRLPAPAFWVEWAEDDGRRTGAFVSGDEVGLRGSLDVFWEQVTKEPDRAQLRLHLDLARRLARAADGRRLFALGEAEHPLAPHLLFELDRDWAAHFHHAGPAAALGAIRAVAADVLYAADILLGFIDLLAIPAALTRTVARSSNPAPSRRGVVRQAFAEHVEVGLALGAGAREPLPGGDGERRGPARLHQVRGHYVQRGGRTFWRRAHARGAATASVATRTTAVVLHQASALREPRAPI